MAKYTRLPSHSVSFENEDWVHVSDGDIHLRPPLSEVSGSTTAELGLPDDPFAFKGWDTKRKETVAMKELIRGRTSPKTLTEIDILKSLPRHPNIVEFKKVHATEGGRVFVVMEHLKYNLHQLRVGRGMRKPFPLLHTKFLMSEILKGVAFLHEQGVVHRDLKPANILLGKGDRVKICDFGLSARLGSRCSSVAGTRSYMAPEVLGRWPGSFTSAIDVWSVGCIMAEFLLGRPIFRGKSDADQLDIIREVLCGPKNLLRVEMTFSGVAGVSLSGFDLLQKLLAFYPSMRISARDALNHHWFTQD